MIKSNESEREDRNESNRGFQTKESEILDKYFNVARELKKLWIMNLTVVPVIDGSVGTQKKA